MATAVFKAVILAVVEGLTEFLPISSTGHLILVEQWLILTPDISFNKAFIIVIQLPAILAVLAYFWRRLWPFEGARLDQRALTIWLRVVAAFLPAMVLGFLFADSIEKWLMTPGVVAFALIIGGIVLIVAERRIHVVRFEETEALPYRTALAIGLIQCIAMIPGTSRSAATIIGGLLLGASRPVAAEFSFFLAIPTMLGATTYTLAKSGLSFTTTEWQLIAVGSVVSFLVAYGVVAFLMAFIRRHSFEIFGWYRIVLGIMVLAYFTWRGYGGQ